VSERVVGAAREREQVEEWALVLAAADIVHRVEESPAGWRLLVREGEAAEAAAALAAYEDEGSERGRPALEYGRSWIGLWLGGLLVALHAAAGERAMRAGAAVAARILGGEAWRSVTALGLHVDLPHLLGNVAAIAVFATVLGRMIGPGLATALVLVAGAGGNGLSAVLHGAPHTAVGASTAVFGTIGVLAGLEFVRRRRMRPGGRAWLAVGGSVALLGMLGTAARADLAAHLLGLLVGGLLGVGTALAVPTPPGRPAQAVLLLGAAAVFGACWNAALR
jgi:membrane associated rhomboid family serine protease